jgi:hypothetical protein
MRTEDKIVLAVLTSPVEMRTADIAKEVGISNESTRRIRTGKTYVELFPEIERLTTEQMVRTCEKCSFFQRKSKRTTWCDLGYPEAVSRRFARGCGAYTLRTEP